LDNVVAALKHNDRIRQLELDLLLPSGQFETVSAAMQRPFPELTLLQLRRRRNFGTSAAVNVVPDTFLGGSAPILETLSLDFIPFPGLPRLLLSATHLVHLEISNIPDSGYFLPEALAASLSALTRLKYLVITFESRLWHPGRRIQHPSLQSRALLSALTELRLRGGGEYLEDLVARIDAPLLERMTITFFGPLIFNTQQLTRFISRTPNFDSFDEARLIIFYDEVSVALPLASDKRLFWRALCCHLDRQLLNLAQACSSSFPQASISAVERLYIQGGKYGREHVENSLWLELLRPFTAVKDLYISWQCAPCIALALHELVGERVREVLPFLETICLEEMDASGPQAFRETIGKFAAARQLAGYTISISCVPSAIFNAPRLGPGPPSRVSP
jgi:hypothetical protein